MKSKIILFALFVIYSNVFGQSVFVTPNSVTQGGSTYAYWAGFSGNVNLRLWKGNIDLYTDIWANAPGSCSGDCKVELNTTGWATGSDYRVVAVLRSNLVKTYSNYFSVTSLPPSVPSLTYPSNGATLNDNTPDFAWTANNASYFDIQVAGSSSFSSILRENTSCYTLNWTPSTMSDGTYYWRVKSFGTNGASSTWSNTYSFVIQTIQPPSIPTLTYPSNGATLNDNTPDFAWTANNASYFDIQVASSSSFSSILRENTSCYTLNWTPSTMSDGTYYWRVKSFGTNGVSSTWSSIYSFVIQTIQPPSIPTLTYPSNGATLNDNTPDLAWTANNANYFDVQIDNNSSFTSIDRENTNCQAFNWTPNTMSDGTYYWRVKSFGTNGVSSIWSSIYSFTIQTVQPSIPILTYPLNGANLIDNTPDLAWTANNANYFDVQIDNNSSFTSIDREETACQGFVWTPSSMTDGTYYWRVRTYGYGTWSNWSEIRNFTLNTTPPTFPTLIAPSGNIALGNEISFSWNSIPNAARYRIKICSDQNMTTQITGSPFEPSLGATNYTISASSFTSGQTYYWQVASILPNDIGGWGNFGPTPSQSFKPMQIQNVNLISPTLNATITSSEIVFSWSPISSATSYELYVDNNSGLGSPEISPNNILELKTLTNTQFTISANWLTPGNTYYWKVIAITPSGNISSTGNFTYSPSPAPQPQWVPFYRTFNPDVVDHFYCSADNHKAQAVEGNYRFEGVEGYVSLIPFDITSPNTLVPIYRFYQTNDLIPKMSCHYYTTDNADRDQRIIEGWIYEGITGYGLSQPEEGLTSLFHTYLNVPNNRRDNFYTISEIQKNSSISMFGYTDVGSLCYISATGDNSTMPWLSGMEVGSGINPQNGNLGHYTNNIFTIPEGKVGLNYSHLYNSLAVRLFKNTDPLGNGWSHSYNVSLLVNDVNIFVVWPDEVNIYNKSTLKSITPDVYDKIILEDGKYKITKKNQTIYTFEKLTSVSNTDNTYLLTSITDRHNNQIILGYNGQGYLKWVKSPENRYLSFTYYPGSDVAKYGLIHYVKDSLALNRKVEYQYDDQRNLVKFIDAKGQGTIYKYEPINAFDHFLESVTYADGTIITNTYDPATKRMTGQNFISNQTQKHTTISIPVSGQVTITDENNKSLTMTSDPKGNITELLTLKGNAKFKYTDTANPTKPTEITDGKGYVTTVIYNTMGDPLTINKPLNIKHQYEWNATNDLVKYINPRNFATSFTYTGNNLTAITIPRGTTNISYFDNGNIQTISDPLSQTITYSYDAYRNVKSVSDVLGNTTQYANDGASRTTRVTDANNQATKYNYDANDLLSSTEDALNKLTYYTFDAGNRLKKVQDARGNSTSLNYNSFSGLLDQTTDQWGNPTKYAYFDNGLLQSVTNRNNQTISYAYDEINRLTSISGPSISRTLTYDKNDNVEKLSDSNGALQFTYDEINRILTQTDFYNNTVSYGYDLAGNIKNINYPGGKSVVYEYEPDNLLKTVTDWDQRKTSYTYRNDGTIDRVTLPNGTYTKYSYDAAGRLTGMENKKSDGTVINSYSYTLDGLGNHVSVSSNEPLASPALEASSVTYNYDQANRILNAGSMTFSHDSNGNLVKQSNNGTVSDFSFDAENKLTGVSGSFNAAYVYDGLGFRRSATRNGVTTRYVLDASGGMENVLVETDASNQALYYYIHGNGLLYRIKATNNSVQYYHYDSRGSTIAITDQNQTITHQYAYDAFGKVTNQIEAEFNPYRYVGKYGVMFENSDLYFMRARYYKPEIGRFLSEDPVWDANLFNYSRNNPILNIDPSGEFVPVILAAYATYKFINDVVDIYYLNQNLQILSNEIDYYRSQQKRYYKDRNANNKNSNMYWNLEYKIQSTISEGYKLIKDHWINLGIGQIPIVGEIWSNIKTLGMLGELQMKQEEQINKSLMQRQLNR